MNDTHLEADGTRSWRPRRLSLLIMAAALALGSGMYVLSSNVTHRDAQRLLVFQAQNVKTTVTALISQIESTLSSVGSVAAVTGGGPEAVDRLAVADSELDFFTTLVIFHRSDSGALAVTTERGHPSAPTPLLAGSVGKELRTLASHGGLSVIGFFGRGSGRHLAVAAGAPSVPGGYVVYGEVPIPAGMTIRSGFPGLQYALYEGRSPTTPVILATTKVLPLVGQRVDIPVDVNDLNATTSRTSMTGTLLLVVSTSGAPIAGSLSGDLPSILALVAILAGLLMAFLVETTARRKDEALALVGTLEERNGQLDKAMAEQVEAEQNRTQLEGELRQAQRLEAVGRLAGGVAHDFNNLLAVVISYSDFIADALGDAHPLQKDLDEIRKAADRATELTRQLLVFSRRDLVNPSVLDVNATIGDVITLLSRTLGEDIVLRSVLVPHLPPVLADSGELEQVLVNLVVNARDSITGEGTITVETSEQVIDEHAARSHADLHPGEYVRITVTDTGGGIPHDIADRIFEPFFTTKGPGGGTGLGLSTVYGIVNRYGGCLTVYSEVGVGTAFKVYLPATEAVKETAVAPSTEESDRRPLRRGTGETVLLVEDEDAVRNACRRILENAGFNVLEASNGSQALDELDNQPIDLLLTDVVMPGGVSGRDLAERLQHVRPQLPVLFMSGYNADAIATRGVLRAGVNVVEKPFTSGELLGKVRELLP